MNTFSRAIAYRITCDRALFLELEALGQRDDVYWRGSSRMSAGEERVVFLEARGEGSRAVMELLKKDKAKEIQE